jgi:dihydroorotate dehydrogenase electron transfer subunit
MLRAVARLTAQLGLQCQLCVERNMGCGIGACLSCVVRVRDAQREAGWRWALACVDGPVFPRDELLDYSGEAGT